MMIITKRFSAIFILEKNTFIKNFLSNINITKDLIILDDEIEFEFNTYTYGGIDFIKAKIDLD